MPLDYKPKSDSLFDKIDSEGEALRTIRVITNVFYGTAAVQAALTLLQAPFLVIIPAMIAGLAYAVREGQSRAAAWCLIGMTFLSLASAVVQMVVTGFPPIVALMVSAVLGGCAIRAVQATTAFHRLRSQPAPLPVPPPIPPL